MTDDYLERLDRHLEAYREDDDTEFIDNPVAYRWLTVGDQRAAVAELKQLRAERALLGAGEVQQRIVTPGGLIYPPSERDLANRDHWLPGVRLERRTVYGTPWEPTDPQQMKHGSFEATEGGSNA